MRKLSSMKFLPVITKILLLVLLAKVFSLGIWWYLPSNGVDHEKVNAYTQSYKRVDFKNMLDRSKAVVQNNKSTTTTLSIANISSIILKGLYGKGKSGFAILAKKTSPEKTSVIAVGELFEGYTLKSIDTFSVTFEKMGKEYIVNLQTNEKLQKEKYATPQIEDGATIGVQKTDINFYRTNPTKLWNDIAINEVFEGKNITGFRVDKIKPNSKIAELGLQKGDVIIRANNIKMDSYKAAMDLYRNIDKIDTLELVVLRNNQEKEIIYEIR